MVLLDPTEGREQHGHRAVLVVSPGAFNEAAKLPVILPITSGGEFRRLGCNPGISLAYENLHPHPDSRRNLLFHRESGQASW